MRSSRGDVSLSEWARLLGGEVCNGEILCPGPGHSARDRSLSVRPDGAARGGCWIHSFAGDDYRSCRDHVSARLGLVSSESMGPSRNARAKRADLSRQTSVRRQEWARRSWRAADPIAGTLAAIYLASRGVMSPSETTDALRYAARSWHPTGFWPAMLGRVVGMDGDMLGIHRTYLAPDGRGKAAIHRNKMMLGPIKGGSVRLSVAEDQLMVGEGIETCLAAMKATGLPAWAALSTSGLATLQLPVAIRRVTILVDGDDAGERASIALSRRLINEGRRVRMARAPCGMDFNDLLTAPVPPEAYNG